MQIDVLRTEAQSPRRRASNQLGQVDQGRANQDINARDIGAHERIDQSRRTCPVAIELPVTCHHRFAHR
jgi:hypothetical protein